MSEIPPPAAPLPPRQPVTPALAEAIDGRRSVPAAQLQEPGPDPGALLRLLSSAVRVPDHGKRVPFRFITLEGDARRVFGEKLARRHRDIDPDAPEALLAKDRQRWLHAPVIVVVVAKLGPDPKIPEQERLLTAGCTCLVLLQAAQAAGFGGCWLTGWAAYDRGVAGILGLSDDEHVAGFVHIGTPRTDVPERERPDPAALLTRWQP